MHATCKANGKECLQAYFASSEWPHHNIQSDCIKNNVLMSTNQFSTPFKDSNAEQDRVDYTFCFWVESDEDAIQHFFIYL